MNAKRSNLLDIIKGMMIIFIITTHFRFSYPDDYRKYGFFYWVDMAVPVFMIITGYLMALNIERLGSVKQAYLPGKIITKALRFLVPWLPCMLIEIPYLTFMKNMEISKIIKCIIGGGTDQALIIFQ